MGQGAGDWAWFSSWGEIGGLVQVMGRGWGLVLMLLMPQVRESVMLLVLLKPQVRGAVRPQVLLMPQVRERVMLLLLPGCELLGFLAGCPAATPPVPCCCYGACCGCTAPQQSVEVR